jgi:DNA helicase II / ATP-dependent DNA helicase PcrA
MLEITEGNALDAISKAKARNISPQDMADEAAVKNEKYKAAIADIYRDYTIALEESNSLDFDDLLLYGVRLFRILPAAVHNIEHVLVDEL